MEQLKGKEEKLKQAGIASAENKLNKKKSRSKWETFQEQYFSYGSENLSKE